MRIAAEFKLCIQVVHTKGPKEAYYFTALSLALKAISLCFSCFFSSCYLSVSVLSNRTYSSCTPSMCDHIQVNFCCGHRRYLVKAWCAIYARMGRTCPLNIIEM
jgi:hypothetical protein